MRKLLLTLVLLLLCSGTSLATTNYIALSGDPHLYTLTPGIPHATLTAVGTVGTGGSIVWGPVYRSSDGLLYVLYFPNGGPLSVGTFTTTGTFSSVSTLSGSLTASQHIVGLAWQNSTDTPYILIRDDNGGLLGQYPVYLKYIDTSTWSFGTGTSNTVWSASNLHFAAGLAIDDSGNYFCTVSAATPNTLYQLNYFDVGTTNTGFYTSHTVSGYSGTVKSLFYAGVSGKLQYPTTNASNSLFFGLVTDTTGAYSNEIDWDTAGICVGGVIL